MAEKNMTTLEKVRDIISKQLSVPKAIFPAFALRPNRPYTLLFINYYTS